MRIRRARLDQRLVAVVPQRDESQVRQGRERGAARADHDPRAAEAREQPPPVPCRGPQSRGEHRWGEVRAGRREAVQVRLVRHDEQHRAAGRDDGGGELGESGRPVLTRQRLPGGAGRAPRDRGRRELGAVRVLTQRVRRCLRARRFRRVLFEHRLLDPGVPGRYRQPEHVGAGARIPCGDLRHEREYGPRQDG
ncbi:hypothetical protein MTP03_29270 [Tsukamurella sp. PLM1]|nr:hypothetical protein MTP03_29270 [Tsukamurella sp. PLM1]